MSLKAGVQGEHLSLELFEEEHGANSAPLELTAGSGLIIPFQGPSKGAWLRFKGFFGAF